MTPKDFLYGAMAVNYILRMFEDRGLSAEVAFDFIKANRDKEGGITIEDAKKFLADSGVVVNEMMQSQKELEEA